MSKQATITIALAVTIGTVHAQDDAAFLRTAFARMDADKDGVLLRKEFPGSDRQFASIDADKDGKATLAEFSGSLVGKAMVRARYRAKEDAHPRTTPAAVAAARFLFLSRADKNGDGRVTRAEWNGTDTAFLQLDLDGNGVIDNKDRVEAAAQAPPAPPPLPEPKGAVQSPEEWLRRFDKNGDAALEQKELRDKWLRAALPWADRDADGILTEDELRTLVDTIRQRRQQAEADRQRPVVYDVPFDAWDKDDDEVLRQNEWQGPRRLFEYIDLNRDVGITRDEVLRYRKRVSGDDFITRFDLDGDGKVTLAEFGGPPGAFQRADRSGDGTVTRADK